LASSALITAGGGTAAREAASARSASRALCGVNVLGSCSGSSGMISAMTGSSGVIMRSLAWICWTIGRARSTRNYVCRMAAGRRRACLLWFDHGAGYFWQRNMRRQTPPISLN
jgi:hypothetical protein